MQVVSASPYLQALSSVPGQQPRSPATLRRLTAAPLPAPACAAALLRHLTTAQRRAYARLQTAEQGMGRTAGSRPGTEASELAHVMALQVAGLALDLEKGNCLPSWLSSRQQSMH